MEAASCAPERPVAAAARVVHQHEEAVAVLAKEQVGPVAGRRRGPRRAHARQRRVLAGQLLDVVLAGEGDVGEALAPSLRARCRSRRRGTRRGSRSAARHRRPCGSTRCPRARARPCGAGVAAPHARVRRPLRAEHEQRLVHGRYRALRRRRRGHRARQLLGLAAARGAGAHRAPAAPGAAPPHEKPASGRRHTPPSSSCTGGRRRAWCCPAARPPRRRRARRYHQSQGEERRIGGAP